MQTNGPQVGHSDILVVMIVYSCGRLATSVTLVDDFVLSRGQ